MADIAKTFSVINQMMTAGIIENYALGGATAVIFYTEPIATEDVDIFVHLKAGGNPFMEFQPIFDYLANVTLGLQRCSHITFFLEPTSPHSDSVQEVFRDQLP